MLINISLAILFLLNFVIYFNTATISRLLKEELSRLKKQNQRLIDRNHHLRKRNHDLAIKVHNQRFITKKSNKS